MGEFTQIGFGRCENSPDQQKEPTWIYRNHQFFDGIGGFTNVLEELGTPYTSDVPTSPHDAKSSWWPFIKALPKLLFSKRKRLDFLPPILSNNQHSMKSLTIDKPPKAVAWHAFSESETKAIINKSKSLGDSHFRSNHKKITTK